MPPNEERPLRWVKLLLYLLIGVGFGELEPEGIETASETTGPPLREAGMPAVRDERFRAWDNALIPDPRGSDWGD